MELRVLAYFLAVAREQSISGAAEHLHLSQPTLSRQLKDLEDDLGTRLLIRGARKTLLTEDGMLLRKRAEEIMALVKKTECELALADGPVAGDVSIGAGETDGIRVVAKAARQLQADYPMIHFHIISGDAAAVTEQLDKGLIDFGLLLGQADLSGYEYLTLPARDTWGVLMRRDAELAEKAAISPDDLRGKPLIVSRQSMANGEWLEWFRKGQAEPDVVATYNLVYNGSLMVEEGMGYALSLDKIIDVSGAGTLCFRPLTPALTMGMHLVWKKHPVFTKAADHFLQKLRREIASASSAK